jgi:signal transduction histidine kinase/CheY-like chemotaxis protein
VFVRVRAAWNETAIVVTKRDSEWRIPASTFIDALGMPACVVERDGRIAHANAAWRGLRPPAGDARGRPSGAARDQLQSIIEQARRHGQAEGQYRDDGLFRARAEALEGSTRLLVTLRPANDEDDLAPAELLDGSLDPVAQLTTEGRISYANPALARLAGRERSDLLGSDFERLIVRDQRPAWRQALRRAESGAMARVSLRLAQADSPAATIAWLIVNDAGQGFHAYGQAISNRAAQETPDRQEQRIDSAAQLAAGISHDFNNLLTVIQGNLSEALALAQRSETTEGELAPLLHGTQAAVENAAELSRQLLTIGRQSESPREPLALGPLVDETLNLLRHTIDPSIELAAEIPPDLLVVASASQIQQVLFNLALNAIDAMPEGGHLRITAAATVRATSELPARSAGYVRIECRDTGIGMDAVTVARIFEPYFSTKTDGNGLGLAMAASIIEEHGGSIDAQSSPGSGTTMLIHLPAAPPTARIESNQPEAAARPRAPRIGASPLVLVVDDHDALRQVCVSILRRAGYRVIEASSGDEALRLLETIDPAPSIALIDASMPGLSGAETAAELLRIAPGLRLLLMSGHAPENVAQPSEGRHRFLQKPFGDDTLLAAIDELTQPA